MSIIKNTEELNNLLDAVQKLPVKKDEQEKVVDITENGTTVVTPDEGMTLGGITVNVAIESGGGTEEIEQIIDQSGVLESTDGTATDKVEQLIDKAEDENIWYELSGYFTDNFPSFSKATCETLPRMNLFNVTALVYKFSGMSNLKRIEHYMNTDNCTRFGSCFQNDSQLEYVKGLNTSKGTDFSWFFANCSSLKIIENPLDFSSATGTTLNPFGGCNALEEIRLVPETSKKSIIFHSPVLSIGNVFNLNDTENVGSVQSIINGLVTLTEGATAQTLTLSKNLPLTEEQKQAITTAVNNKGWTLAFA